MSYLHAPYTRVFYTAHQHECNSDARERERLCRRRQRFHFALLCGIGTVRQFLKKKCKFNIHIFFF